MAFAKEVIKAEYYNQKPDLTKERWWRAPDDKIHILVTEEAERIKKAQSQRMSRLTFLSQIYQNEDISPFRSGYYIQNRISTASRPTINVIKSNTDTLCSKISTKKPRPVFLTKKGSWSLQRRAKNLTKYIEGVFQTGGAYPEGRMAFRDACITGSGFIHPKIQGKKIVFERVSESEIIVDEYEAIYGRPPQLFREYWVQVDILKEQYPDLSDEIDDSASTVVPEGGAKATIRMVRVTEAWRPKTDFSKGKWAKVISKALLESEEYDSTLYPFAGMRYTKKLFGYFGLSLSEDVLGIQLEINKLLRTIAKAQHLMSAPQVWLEASSAGVTNQLSNKIGGRNYYKGNPPMFLVPQAMGAEVYNHLEYLVQKSYQVTGVSQLSAMGKKPSGVDAKVALRELQDIESERFQVTEQGYDEMYLELVPIVIELTERLSKVEKNLMVKVAGKREMEAIRWSDVKMEMDQYIFQIFPSSLLPSTPSGRLQFVQEMMQSGIYDKESAVALLDFPDVEAANSQITATRDGILRIIADIEDEKGYDPPEPEMHLEYALALSTTAYNAARNDGAPPTVTEDMLGLIDDIKGLIEKRDQAAARKAHMIQQGGNMPPQNSLMDEAGALAKPAAPPVSELMAIA